MAFDSEHGHPHAHGSGVKWLDVTVGVSVVFISVLSLWVSIEHGRIMERMAAQNERMAAGETLPLLELGTSNVDPKTGEHRITVFVKNGGVGPARIEWFELGYKGVSQPNLASLLTACCVTPSDGPAKPLSGVFFSNTSNTVIPARESVDLITMTSKAPPALYSAFEARGRAGLSARACYCSVMDLCWSTEFGTERPKPVHRCVVPAGLKPW